VESATMLTFAHEEAEGLARRIALLKGELAEAHRAREMAEENSRGLSNATADGDQR
jgi:hypothetical protein